MTYRLTGTTPIVPAIFRIGPESLDLLEGNYAKKLELWPLDVPKEVRVNALIDTGASISILDEEFIEQMNLSRIPRSFCPVSGFDSPKDASGEVKEYPNYEMGLSLLDRHGKDAILKVTTGQIVGQRLNKVDALIGMDVLSHCHFHLDGPNGCFEIIAPNPEIDEIRSIASEG